MIVGCGKWSRHVFNSHPGRSVVYDDNVGDRVELDLRITTHTWERRVAPGIQYNTYCWEDMSNFATCGRWLASKYSGGTVAATWNRCKNAYENQ
uniref:Uncharacterized protein n=1 Tax=Pristionchus pacificus TaxID=54126 RepID=A0A8R1V1H2_PRIPA